MYYSALFKDIIIASLLAFKNGRCLENILVININLKDVTNATCFLALLVML